LRLRLRLRLLLGIVIRRLLLRIGGRGWRAGRRRIWVSGLGVFRAGIKGWLSSESETELLSELSEAVRARIPGGEVRKGDCSRRGNIGVVSGDNHSWCFDDVDDGGYVGVLFGDPHLDGDVEALGLEEDGDCAVEGKDVDVAAGKNSCYGMKRWL